MTGFPGLTLACAAVRDRAKAQAWLDAQRIVCPLVELDAMPDHADLAVECAPAAAIEDICRPMLEAGKAVMVLSAGRAAGAAASDGTRAGEGRPDHRADRRAARARRRHGGGRGPDRLGPHDHPQAARTGSPARPTWSRTASRSTGSTPPKRVFAGNAREAAAGFPANVNVAAALSLAGIGPEQTTIEIWADPSVDRNCHTIEVEADSARFSLTIENVPSENPKTGKITALSVLAALRKLHAPLRVGT